MAMHKMPVPNPTCAQSTAKAEHEVVQPRYLSIKGRELERNVQKADAIDDETAENFAKAILDMPKERL
jgi:hypothetical protein